MLINGEKERKKERERERERDFVGDTTTLASINCR